MGLRGVGRCVRVEINLLDTKMTALSKKAFDRAAAPRNFLPSGRPIWECRQQDRRYEKTTDESFEGYQSAQFSNDFTRSATRC